jgi:hypothetical protein
MGHGEYDTKVTFETGGVHDGSAVDGLLDDLAAN